MGFAYADPAGNPNAIACAVTWNTQSLQAADAGTRAGASFVPPAGYAFGSFQLRIVTNSSGVTRVEFWCLSDSSTTPTYLFPTAPTGPLLVCEAFYSDGSTFGRSIAENLALTAG